MRFGIGLELWTGDTTEEEHYAGVVQPIAEPPKKKEVAQEITKSPSSLTEPQLKEMVFSMCNEDKDFAKKCYDTSMTRFKMDKSIGDNVADWSNDNVDKFLKLVEDYVQKYKDEFEKRAGNSVPSATRAAPVNVAKSMSRSKSGCVCPCSCLFS